MLRTLEDGRITEIHLKEVREIKEDNEEIDSDEEIEALAKAHCDYLKTVFDKGFMDGFVHGYKHGKKEVPSTKAAVAL